MKFEYFQCAFVIYKDTYTMYIDKKFLSLRHPLKPSMTFSKFHVYSIDFC
jgi:hypothetical protein